MSANWMPFQEARLFAIGLKLGTEKRWRAYCRGEIADKPPLPIGMPEDPARIYANKGWCGWRDWLGDRWWPYKQANDFVLSLGLDSIHDWVIYCKGNMRNKPPLPAGIPKSPNIIYRFEGWKSWDDWLGGGWLPFEQARAFVRSLNFTRIEDWRFYCRGVLRDRPALPKNIPKSPAVVYAQTGWSGWDDWLNSAWRPFAEAHSFVLTLGIRKYEQWLEYVNGKYPALPPLPIDIPKSPDKVYQHTGWQGWGHWLRGKSISNRKPKRKHLLRPPKRKTLYRPFAEARQYARNLQLKSSTEWLDYCIGKMPHLGFLPDDIPSSPHRTYVFDGWKGYVDWLGYEQDSIYLRRNAIKRPFHAAREFARSLGLKGQNQWHKYCHGEYPDKPAMPIDIPKNPMFVYGSCGWIGFPDWLGYPSAHGPWIDFHDAHEFAASLSLKSAKEWQLYCKGRFPQLPKRPVNIPVSPQIVYNGKGWKGWPFWLGNKPGKGQGRKWRSFEASRVFTRHLELKSVKDWQIYCKSGISGKPAKPIDIPTCPDRNYKNAGWIDWYDWLGITIVARHSG